MSLPPDFGAQQSHRDEHVFGCTAWLHISVPECPQVSAGTREPLWDAGLTAWYFGMHLLTLVETVEELPVAQGMAGVFEGQAP